MNIYIKNMEPIKKETYAIFFEKFEAKDAKFINGKLNFKLKTIFILKSINYNINIIYLDYTTEDWISFNFFLKFIKHMLIIKKINIDILAGVIIDPKILINFDIFDTTFNKQTDIANLEIAVFLSKYIHTQLKNDIKYNI